MYFLFWWSAQTSLSLIIPHQVNSVPVMYVCMYVFCFEANSLLYIHRVWLRYRQTVSGQRDKQRCIAVSESEETVSQSVSQWVSLLFQGGNSSSDSRAALLKIQLNIELLHWISLFVNAWPASAYSKLISFPLAIDLFIYLFRFYCMLELRAAVNRYQIYFPLVLCYISRSKLWGVDGWEMN